MSWLVDRKVRLPRIWSNRELEKFANLFTGEAVNVSGWNDKDKQGRRYRDYFSSATTYWVTNYVAKAKGMQEGLENQIFLDLEAELRPELRAKFDVVFNHTVLEHIFEVDQAFCNLCELTSDVLIVVVPFLQHQHAPDYGDFWRFTPTGVKRLFEKNHLELVYINYNDGPNQSVYVFAIGTRKPQNWVEIRNHQDNKLDHLTEKVGNRVVSQGILLGTKNALRRVLSRVFYLLSPTKRWR